MEETKSTSHTEEKRSELVRASDVLPSVIPIVPQNSRPLFPGQIVPLIIDIDPWEATFRAAHEQARDMIGVAMVDVADGDKLQTQHFARMGTACRIHKIHKHENKLQVLIEGLQRFTIKTWLNHEQPFRAQVDYHPEAIYKESIDIKAYAVAVINTIKELLPLNPLYGEELKVFLEHFHPNEPSRLADFSAALTTAAGKDLQDVLETLPLLPRLEKTLQLLNKELEVAKAQTRIRKRVEDEIQGRQREMILREQLKAIQKELGISKDDRTAEVDIFKERLEALTPSPEAQERIDDELHKLSLLETGSPEYAVTRNYLDWLTLLPWGTHSEDALDLDLARKVLDKEHEGLEDVKERILEFIGVGIMRGQVAGSILLFVGPPGVGKTSLGRSIADALNRKFFRFSVGGMRDEAEIKGHRRTYIGAMPGKFVRAIKDAGTANPVIMLDEIDKIGASYQGDPASALLEVLDPEQNVDFLDHYLDVRFDLSKALFICTANQLDTIPGPLLDRMEIINLSGYLASEKLAIARKHLWPRQLQRAGLKKRGQVNIDAAALKTIIEAYAREAGVRKLEKLLGRIIRKAVLKILGKAKQPIKISKDDVETYLGKPVFEKEKPLSGIGVVTGLAWTPLGGATLNIEATKVHSRNSGFKLTGQLGDVMRESAEIAYSYVTANAEKWAIEANFFADTSIHLHVPAGATPKDGPSAGVTMATALISLAKQQQPKRTLAMTGELTLTGKVFPVGGISEKLIAAKRADIKEVILPQANHGDFDELPAHIKKGLKVHFASEYQQIGELLFR